jgi:hypothetical protein
MLKYAVAWMIITGCLKAAGVLSWPWLAVTGPVLAVLAVLLFCLVILGGCTLFVEGIKKRIKERQK